MYDRTEELKRASSYFKKPLSSLDRESEWSEQVLTNRIASYLREHHPTIPFQVDMSGVALSKIEAKRSATNRAGMYKQPDLTIYVKKGKYGCLMLELKKLKSSPFKKDGTLKKSDHLELQGRSIHWLRRYGQCADFSVGFEETVRKINDYLEKGEIRYSYE